MEAPVIVGRELERHRLLDALGDARVRTITLRGTAGQGKTALALEATHSLRGAFVGYGKHADDASGRGLRALGEALRMLLEQGLEQLYDVDIGLASLRQALGASASALSALDRELFADIVPDAAPPLSAGAAVERLGLAVERLLGWMHGFKAPLVLVLDDWGRAAPSTEELYRRLAASERHAVTLVGTERGSEPSRVVADVAVDLAPISPAGIQAIAASHLDGDEMAAAAVVEAFGEVLATPLQLVQSLAVLVRSGALVRAHGAWSLDRGAAAALLGVDAATALVRRSVRASPDLRCVLEAVVVAGDRATSDDVAAVSGLDRARVEAAVAAPHAQGLVDDLAGDLRVVHDTVRSAVLADLQPEGRRSLAEAWATHLGACGDLRGGRLEAALRLRLDAGLEAAAPVAWIDRFVAGAAAARAAGAAEQARTYASAALKLEARAGTAVFIVAQEAAQAALQGGDLRAGAELATLMQARARSEEERLLSAEAALLCARLSGRAAEGLRLARAAIATQGLKTPDRVNLPQAVAAIVRLRLTSDKPRPTRLRADSALYRVLNTAGYMAFEQEPRAAVVLSARAAAFAPLRGTAYAAGLRATLSCLSGDWNAAIGWGRAAFERLDRPEPLRAPALHLTLQFGAGLELDGERTFAESERLQALAIEEGDLGIAAYANRDRALSSLRLPRTLGAHRRTLADCRALAARFEDQATGPLIGALDQMAHNLAEGGDQPWRLQGDIFDSPRFEREADEETKRIATAFLLLEAMLANAFGAWETTVAVHARMNGRFDNVRHHPWIAGWSFHTGLARARLGLRTPRWERFSVARHARVNTSFLHRHLALEAERRLGQGRVDEAMVAYESAIVAADASGFRLEHGVTASAAVAAARSAGRGAAADRFEASRRAAWGSLGATALLEGAGGVLRKGASRPPSAAARDPASGAERASRAKTRLLAEAAHELRTPMQGIQGLLDLAAGDPAALDVARVQDAFSGLRAVVDDLTDFGAVEAERLSLVEAPFSPLRLLETEVALASPEAERRHRVLRLVSEADQAASVCGDAGRIAQIVRNLLSNALRYGDGEVSVRLHVDHTRLTVEVADEGAGLSQADLTRLFQPFVRGDASVRAEGSGLGLALSRRLAERMGGQLTGANREPSGALFRLELPHRSAEAGPAVAAPTRRPLRVLLAEDVDLSRETMARLLERGGHAVVAVADGEGALAAGLATDFDVLVLDARMPRLGGAEALRRLRETGCVTPALVVSAAPDAELAGRLRDLQPVRLARKPLAAGQLQALLYASAADADRSVDPPPEAVAAELAARTDALVGAFDRGDLDAVRELAHAAAGLAAQFGFTESEARFAVAEAAAKRRDRGAVERAVAGLVPVAPAPLVDGT